MGQRKKVGKERQDKYYHLAKTQGYRARSAFKLIQLNKKFGFLEKARVLIDLCAAPGGWLQVAAKYMPVSSIIVGVDLAPIKPIPRVITHVEDITTDSCRSTLKKDLKDWRADVVLHDGAPNVGTAWVQDAYAQSELVLHSLRLATDFLAPNGTFVTKVFRSQNYNHLLYVFNQLFEKVDATKPPSSRNVSAEIFVVCRGYKAPKHIDPKFLDPRHVFLEVDDDENAPGGKMNLGVAMNAILFPEKTAKKRQRQGYADGDYTLHHAATVVDFIQTPSEAKAIEVLASNHELLFDSRAPIEKKQKNDEESTSGDDHMQREELLSAILKHPDTTDEVKTCCGDLKVLGRKEYKSLLKWRKDLRKDLLQIDESKKSTSHDDNKKQDDSSKSETREVVSVEQMEDQEDSLDELDELTAKTQAVEKKLKKKRLRKIAKERRRMQLNMITPNDIGIEEETERPDEAAVLATGKQNDELFHNSIAGADIADADMDKYHELIVDESGEEDQEKVMVYENEEDLALALEEEMNESYEMFKQRQTERNKRRLAKEKLLREKEFRGIEEEMMDKDSDDDLDDDNDYQKNESDVDSYDSDSSCSIMSEDDDEQEKREEEPETPVELSKKAKKWFSQDIFEDIDLTDDENDEHPSLTNDESPERNEVDVKEQDEEGEGKEDLKAVEKAEKKRRREVEEAKKLFSDPHSITLALEMIKDGGRGKNDLIDELAYRRNVYHANDELPDWFIDDERKHNRPNLPVTKEAVQIAKERQKLFDSRPIKKVVEAKARKKRKAMKKLDGVKEKLNSMIEEEDDAEVGAKLGQANSIMKKAVAKAKASMRRKVTLVVAKGSNRGNAGRPKGVKGRYKMVDPRMLKETRAIKRKEKAGKKGKRR